MKFEGTEISKAPGRVARHSASSRATSPTPTTTRSCSTGTSTPNNTFGVTGGSHTARENPADANSKALETVFEDLTAYKNRNGGIWGRGEHAHIQELEAGRQRHRLYACVWPGRSATPLRQGSSTRCSWAKPRTSATPRTDAEKAYGRSLPKPEMPDFPIRGYEYYDLRHDVVNTTFRNFEDNATRKTGALSYLLFTSFAVTSNNTVERVKFVNAKPVYFPPMAGNAKWASDNGSSVAYKTAAIRDKDGSLGGGPNSYVLINDGVNDTIAADPQACEIKPTWNAAVCKGDVGRLSVGGPGGGRGGPGRGGPAGRWRWCRSWRTGCSSRCWRSCSGSWPGRAWRSRRCGRSWWSWWSWCWWSWPGWPVRAHLVVEPAVPVQHLLSRQSILSRNGKEYNRDRRPPYAPVPRSR